MNKKRREQLDAACSLLDQASDIIESVRDDEQDSYDNLPENLQCSERAEAMESAIDALDSAIESIREASDYVSEAKG